MLATARLLGMTLGATIVALVFHVAPDNAEPVGLAIATAFALAAAILSGLRRTHRAIPAV